MELNLEVKKWEYKVRDANQELLDVLDQKDQSIFLLKHLKIDNEDELNRLKHELAVEIRHHEKA